MAEPPLLSRPHHPDRRPCRLAFRVWIGVLLAAAAPVSAQRAFAPQFGVDRWTTEEGLPGNSIVDLVQSEDGYLWLIASGLVVRFDGTRFISFEPGDSSETGLPDARPLALLATGRDTVWAVFGVVGTTHIVRFTAGRPERVTTVPGDFTGMARDGAGTLWLLSYGELRSFDGERTGESVRYHYSRSNAMGFEIGPQSVLDRFGDLWVRHALRDSVGWLRDGNARIAGPSAFPVLVHRPATGDVLFPAVLGDSLMIRDREGAEVLTIRRPAGSVPRLVDRRGRLWATTPSGLDVYDAGSMEPVASVPLEPASVISELVEDREGNLWARSFTEGLYRIRELPAHAIGTGEGLVTSQVMMVAPGRDGSMLATDGDGRVYRVTDGRARLLYEPDGPNMGSMFTVAEDRSGTLWIPFSDGRRTPGYGVIARRREEPDVELQTDAHVRSIVEDPRPGGDLWFGSPNVYRVERSGSSFVLADTFRVGVEPIRDLALDASGALWVPGDSALLRISAAGVESYRDPLYPDRVARSILADDDGTLWIGTYRAGLLRFRDGVFSAVTAADGLMEDVVSTFLDDGAGNFWMAGNRSIHRVRRADVNAFMDGSLDRVEGVAYGRTDGIPNPETSGWQAARDDAGRLWFATFGGIVVIDPLRALELESDTPVVHIEEIRLANGESRTAVAGGGVPDGQALRLAAGERRFDIAYTAISLRNPAALRFRYRLDGVDENWRDAGNARTATYTNVGAGRYTFRVQAVSGGGIRAREATLALVVEPFFYETSWFFALVALAFLGTGVLIVRWRERSLVVRQTELNRLVAERTAALDDERRRAEEALGTVAAQADRLRSIDRARSRFFANVSHEFRTPLTLIEGPLRDLQQGRLGPLPEAAKNEIDVVLESGQRLNELVEQLLDIARLEVGELKLKPQAGDIVAFLRRVARSFDPLARARGVTFDVVLPDEAVMIVFDPDRLEKVISNLVGNAFKFTDRGGHVRMIAGLDREAEAAVFRIAVEDDGIGIPEEALDRVFDRFYQVDDSPSRQHQGAGVGLALTKDLVELHGGSIGVTSEVGVGSTFTVRLPHAQDSPLQAYVDDGRSPDDHIASHATAAAAVGTPSTDREKARDVTTVLLVEDNERVRTYLRRHLEGQYDVIEAENGLTGLEQARRVVPDLIISDIMMPEMDGQTMVEEIRQDPDIDFLPVILLTAKASHESVLEGLRGGADDYLTKPFDVEELLLRAHNLIAGRHRLRERFRASEKALPALPLPVSGRAHESGEFAARVYSVLAEHLDDEEFGVDELARGLFLSRSSLYRRIEENLGMPPMQLILGFRLDQAAQWLRETDARVNEIAYGVGFKSVPHFSRRFREHFGMTPTAYRQSIERP